MPALSAHQDSTTHKLIVTLVDTIMQRSTDSEVIQQFLIGQGVYSRQQVRQLSDEIITAVYRALLIKHYQQLPDQQLMTEMRIYGLAYSVNLTEDYSAAAVAY
ncbi:hypothetical protein KCM76_16590 [Zooshikella marina]|uniref:Uncharacterized protein n=1 Tax=Zooshikella ganghwensis TaxID=202772 RepID=A0A4P9VP87_9GAMM|nr:hypothetical protein [Zooshikella ganghwensis]MBU2707614.1 hypothetical protein [Zooshikella ganghwensis]RDH44736.1 hypothetical protein B9G39_15565 [Zooshikella ganghwensis]